MTQIEALKAIADRNGGTVTPREVVDEARPEDSPLHGAFEWDDGAAAEKYRLEQAQRLIRSFRVIVGDGAKTVEVPAFIGVSIDRTEGKADNPYRLAEVVMRTPDLVSCAVEDALGQLNALRERYKSRSDLGEVWEAIDRATKRAAEKRKRNSAKSGKEG